jgi:hypothetical protein
MKARYAWLILLAFVIVWDVVAAMTNGQTLTYAFRRGVTDSVWRWPALVVIALLVVHLFLPTRLREHDPLDRLYERVAAASRDHEPSPAPPPSRTKPVTDTVEPHR